MTTVRDCGSRGTFLGALRDGIAAGLLPGPRLLVCGPPLTSTAGHLWVCGGEVDTAEGARALVRRLVKEGADFIKVMATGGRMTPGTNVGRAQFSVAELRAIVEDAHRLGRRVAAHCLGTEGIANAVEAGVDTVEHCDWLDAGGEAVAFDEGVARRMAERGIYRNMAAQPNRVLAEKPRSAPLSRPSGACWRRPSSAGTGTAGDSSLASLPSSPRTRSSASGGTAVPTWPGSPSPSPSEGASPPWRPCAW